MNFNILPLYLKELSFCYLAADPTKYTYAKGITEKDRNTSNFALRLSDYLNNACGLPPEFHEIYSKAIVFGEY